MAKSRRGDVYVRKPSGRSSYTATFWVGGRRYDIGTGCPDRAGAVRVAREVKAARERERPAPGESLSKLLGDWLAGVERVRSSGWCYSLKGYAAREWLTRWERLSDIGSASIQNYITERMREVSSVTVLKELAGLRMFLRWCSAAGLIAEVPKWVPPRKVSDYKPACLTDKEVAALLAQMKGESRDFVEFIWETSLRAGTVASILWEDVDLEARTLRVRASNDKNRYDRVVPLSEGAIAVLGRRVRSGDYVFKRRNCRKALISAAKRAGINVERIGTHTFRHSRITDLAGRTTNISALQYIAGHKSLASTNRYVHGRFEQAKELIWGKQGDVGSS